MIEVWMPVVGYEGIYEVSNHGRIKSLKFGKEKIRSLNLDGWGYFQVGLNRDGRERKMLVHRLVANAFLDNPEAFKQVNHIDGCKTNNDIRNLEWCDQSHNQKHAWETGLKKYVYYEHVIDSSRKSQAKLSEEQVKQIRHKFQNDVGIDDLKTLYGVSYTTIHSIVNNKSWKHLICQN